MCKQDNYLFAFLELQQAMQDVPNEQSTSGYIDDIDYIWASSRENLSSGFPTKRVSNRSPQLARKLKFYLIRGKIWYLPESE